MTSSDSDHEPSFTAAIVDSVLENLKQVPASAQARFATAADTSRSSPIFGRRPKRVHELLGGGHSADVLLWRKKHLSAGFLAGATALWVLFQWIGYHFVSVVSLLLLGVVVILFVWSNAAAFLNRAPPPVPRLQLSKDQVLYVADNVRFFVNRSLSLLFDIATGTDTTNFLKLVGVLGFLVIFGSWFNLITLCFIAVVAAHTLPLLYEKHGETIDQFADSMLTEVNKQYRQFDASVMSRIPRRQSALRKKAE